MPASERFVSVWDAVVRTTIPPTGAGRRRFVRYEMAASPGMPGDELGLDMVHHRILGNERPVP